MKNLILFIDDEPAVLDAFRRMLKYGDSEWATSFALSVDEALKIISELECDVIVSDITMPGKSGLDLLRILRESEKTRNIPVVIVTGNADRTLKRQALDLGAADLLNKPVDFDDLVARIRSAIRLKSYQDEIRTHNQLLEQRVRERTIELELSRRDIIGRLAKAGEYRDEATGNHVARVGWYCRAIAGALGLCPSTVDLVFLASPLHDIGKIGIPDAILLKPDRLSPEERKVMEQHCAIGTGILSECPKVLEVYGHNVAQPMSEVSLKYENPLLQMASSIALGHHEKWDGEGYPNRVRGDKIPLEARIAAVADVFDALGTKRPYKPAYAEEKARAIMRKESGKHFDPDVYAAFEKASDEIRLIQHKLRDETTSPVSEGAEP